jgi:hypothetical protein
MPTIQKMGAVVFSRAAASLYTVSQSWPTLDRRNRNSGV